MAITFDELKILIEAEGVDVERRQRTANDPTGEYAPSVVFDNGTKKNTTPGKIWINTSMPKHHRRLPTS